jgi:ribosomal protein S18 acetylase RimI-like enzyme
VPDMERVTFKTIPFGTQEYARERELRDEVLRRPLGLSLSADDLKNEQSQLHFGLFDPAGGLVACVIAVPLSPTDAKIRQMAVAPAHQRRGLGQRIMGEVERELRARGVAKLTLNARESAVGFYEKLGYRVVGDRFVDRTVPHFRMVKSL